LGGDELLPLVGGHADAFGVALAACRADGDFHIDILAAYGSHDTFLANGVFFCHGIRI
jgi:hypothetical protein